MLRVTCNNVVQQHLTVVQQLQQLSSTTITAKISREADTKKPTVLLVGLVDLEVLGYSASSTMPFALSAARIFSAVLISPSKSSCVA